MSPSLTVADCPECRGVRTVILGTCEVCFAEFGDSDDDLSHGGSAPPSYGLGSRAPIEASRHG